jgi:soluble epoxide hydrolase/lipid-phosphate phosphatase
MYRATLQVGADMLWQDYLEALPKGTPKGTIVLIHGFPDISLGWRYQIPYLVDLGYRTIALDCMGYGKTVC